MKIFGGSDKEIIIEITMTIYFFPEFHDFQPILPVNDFVPRLLYFPQSKNLLLIRNKNDMRI